MDLRRRPFCQQAARLSLLALGLGSPYARAAEPLHLVTGDLPPCAIVDDAQAPGLLVELTVEAARRAGWPLRAEFQPWARAVLSARQQPRTLVLPLTRTPEREAQFQWIARIGVQQFGFLNRAPAARVASLQQALALRIGVLRGSPHVKRLTELGFDTRRLVLAKDNDDLQRMLGMTMVEAIYGSLQINHYNARRLGGAEAALQTGWVVESGEIWLAAGSGLSEAEIDALRGALEAMQRDGFTERLHRRYGVEAVALR